MGLFKHDSGTKSLSVTAGSLVVITILTLTAIVGGTVALGEKVNAPAGSSSGPEETVFDMMGYTQSVMTRSEPSEMLPEGESMTYNVSSTPERVLTGMKLTLTWEDETEKPGRPTIRRYTNQPDTFNITVETPNSTTRKESSNQIGLPGQITMDVAIPENTINEYEGSFQVDITVTMVEAGPWTGLSLLAFVDQGNGYDLVMELTYLESPAEEEPEGE
jgi:hypothetical protein